MIRNIPSSVALPFRRAQATSSTDTSFTGPTTTTTKPSTGVVVDTGLNGTTPTYLMLQPFGAGADDSTFVFRVIGWRVATDDTNTALWVPAILLVATATLSTAVGAAGAVLSASERLADTIVVSVGNANVDYVVTSVPAANTPAHLLVDTKGCPLVQLTFDLTGATGANALVAAI